MHWRGSIVFFPLPVIVFVRNSKCIDGFIFPALILIKTSFQLLHQGACLFPVDPAQFCSSQKKQFSFSSVLKLAWLEFVLTTEAVCCWKLFFSFVQTSSPLCEYAALCEQCVCNSHECLCTNETFICEG